MGNGLVSEKAKKVKIRARQLIFTKMIWGEFSHGDDLRTEARGWPLR